MKKFQSLFIAKSVYFFYYGAWACLLPFLVLYYQSLGFSGTQIGVLASISPLATLVVAPLWGALADTTQKHKTILLTGVLGAALSVLAFSQARSYGLIAVLVAAYAAFGATIIPLIDNSVLALLGDRRDLYGSQRLWGAVGWGIASPVMGWLTGVGGLRWSFVGYLALAAVLFLTVMRLPVHISGQGSPFWTGVGRLLADRRWFLFLGVVFISGAGLSVTSNFLFLYMADMNASRAVMGLALAMATISELPVLFYSGRILRRWGPRGLLVVSLAAIVVRSYAYAIATQPWQVLIIQLMHGLTFSTMWVAGVSFAGEIAPPGMGATAQGLFSSTVMGFGGITGALAGGLLIDHFGGTGMYLWTGTAVLLGLLVFLAFGRKLLEPAAKGVISGDATGDQSGG